MSKRILFIAQHRPQRSPSQRFRFEQYLSLLEQEGYRCDFSYLINEKDDKIFYKTGNLLSKLKILLKSYYKRHKDLATLSPDTIVFVQREAFMTGSVFFEKGVKKTRAKLIFDFDDSIWLQNVSDANRYLKFLKNPRKTRKIIDLADRVVAGNQYLADFAAKTNKHVSIIPTTIDTDAYQKVSRPQNDSLVIGWSGSITTIQHFEYAILFLKRIKDEYGNRVKIKVIGDANYSNEELGVKGIAWNEADELKELSEFDIGIMPLPDGEWAKGKCGLKGLQYMALEIPTIMSRVGVNSEIIQHGENGMLASSHEEWYGAIKQLIEDTERRINLGKKGRDTVVSEFSVQANANKYLNLFEELS